MVKALTAPKPQQVDQPSPADLPGLHRKVAEARIRLGRLTRSGSGGVELLVARVDLALSRINTVRAVRVFQLYLRRRGPLMAAGLAYRLFFAIAALLVIVFAALGIVIAGNEDLQDIAVDLLDQAVPGLIDQGEGQAGLVTPDALFEATSGLGWTIVISAGVMVVTSLGWIGGMRQAMRGIFGLPPVVTIPLVLWAKDLVTLALLGVVMVVTTALGVVATNTLGALLSFLDLGAATQGLTQAAGFAIMILLDTFVVVVLLRSSSAITMPKPILLQGALIAGLGTSVLRFFSTQIVGLFGNSVILLSVAVVVALFVWFYLLSQVYLLATAWCAVGTADAAAESARLHHAKAGSLRQRSRRKTRT
ncbi:YihY/virulence factor BrkB family protein [Arthrobacter sp. SX1312]|uniref:YihY/virulence factor BrkB family protein n=1 Tax=Arthrobacter sp. SX1312 TaxID=2058896 RepID=UPI000CE3FD69|nr:YihY/virulence factor BrkB family protein [Arthrobacter sp. SX1312]